MMCAPHPQSSDQPSVVTAATTTSAHEGSATSPVQAAETPDENATALQAVLSPDNARFISSVEGSLTATVTNHGPGPAELRMIVLAEGILSLDIFDASGKRIPTIPPSMPPTPEEDRAATEWLQPGESKTIHYSLHMFSPELPPGTYRAKLRGLASNEVSFTIQGP